jgi:hypothetical protein
MFATALESRRLFPENRHSRGQRAKMSTRGRTSDVARVFLCIGSPKNRFDCLFSKWRRFDRTIFVREEAPC